MSLSDTAEYWWDIKKPNNKRVFVHVKGLTCGHFHVIESNEYNEIDCHACKKLINQDAELKVCLEKNNGKIIINGKKKYTLDNYHIYEILNI